MFANGAYLQTGALRSLSSHQRSLVCLFCTIPTAFQPITQVKHVTEEVNKLLAFTVHSADKDKAKESMAQYKQGNPAQIS